MQTITKTGSEERKHTRSRNKIKQEIDDREWENMRNRNKLYTNINTGIYMKHKEALIKLKTLFIKRRKHT